MLHGTTVFRLYTTFVVCATNGVPVELLGKRDFLSELSSEQLGAIFGLLAQQTGLPVIDAYKESCIRRRVAGRIRRSGCRDVDQYLQLLEANSAEQERLVASLMIHVSHFFRNSALFEMLQTTMLPSLIERSSGRQLRFWSIGCSAGEEPYSLAILLVEAFAEQVVADQFKILATDIDNNILTLAKAALYEESALREVSSTRREQFFSEAGDAFQLCPAVQKLVQFRQMDLHLVDHYPLADLVLCRNTLIYFNRPAQEKILQAIADILPQDGILVLGKSESMPSPLRDRFATLDPIERIYSRR